MVACSDEAGGPMLDAERAGKGYLKQAMARGKTQ